MTGGVLVLAIVGAGLIVALGIQIASRHLQRYPADTRSAGSLIETASHTSFVRRPAELDQLNAIVGGALTSEAVAESKLQPLLAELDRAAPARSSQPPTAWDSQDRSVPLPRASRRSRNRQLEAELDRLEAAWGLATPNSGAGSS